MILLKVNIQKFNELTKKLLFISEEKTQPNLDFYVNLDDEFIKMYLDFADSELRTILYSVALVHSFSTHSHTSLSELILKKHLNSYNKCLEYYIVKKSKSFDIAFDFIYSIVKNNIKGDLFD